MKVYFFVISTVKWNINSFVTQKVKKEQIIFSCVSLFPFSRCLLDSPALWSSYNDVDDGLMYLYWFYKSLARWKLKTIFSKKSKIGVKKVLGPDLVATFAHASCLLSTAALLAPTPPLTLSSALLPLRRNKTWTCNSYSIINCYCLFYCFLFKFFVCSVNQSSLDRHTSLWSHG